MHQPVLVPPEPTTSPASTTPSDTTTSGWRVAFLSTSAWPAVLLAGFFAVGILFRVRTVWAFLTVAAIAVVLETVFKRHDQPVLRSGLRTDVVHFLFTHFLSAVALGASALICYVLLRRLTIPMTRDWLVAQPAAVTGVLGFTLFTLLLYWHHRLSHRIPFLWRFHAVHHSSANLDWLASARLHPLELFFAGFLVAPPLILLGFPPVSIGIFATLTTAWAVLEHANVRWRLRFMDRLYPNPEYHHWHHSLHAEAIDKNFGIPIWDTLFGSYYMPKDSRPDSYGIREPMPDTYIGQLAQPFRRRTG